LRRQSSTSTRLDVDFSDLAPLSALGRRTQMPLPLHGRVVRSGGLRSAGTTRCAGHRRCCGQSIRVPYPTAPGTRVLGCWQTKQCRPSSRATGTQVRPTTQHRRRQSGITVDICIAKYRGLAVIQAVSNSTPARHKLDTSASSNMSTPYGFLRPQLSPHPQKMCLALHGDHA
jgi:hypothetical protein